MKRLIAAVSFAVLAVPALATPFELTQFNRTLPNVPQRTVAEPASAGASVVTTGAGLASGVWANDHNFISPAQ